MLPVALSLPHRLFKVLLIKLAICIQHNNISLSVVCLKTKVQLKNLFLSSFKIIVNDKSVKKIALKSLNISNCFPPGRVILLNFFAQLERDREHKTYKWEHGRAPEWQICLWDLHVTTACLDSSGSHSVFGFPIDYLAGRRKGGGKKKRLGLLERVRWRFFQSWQAVDSWTSGSSFSSKRGWNFSPWKSRVINHWGSQNYLSECFLFLPFSYFACPSFLTSYQL